MKPGFPGLCLAFVFWCSLLLLAQRRQGFIQRIQFSDQRGRDGMRRQAALQLLQTALQLLDLLTQRG